MGLAFACSYVAEVEIRTDDETGMNPSAPASLSHTTASSGVMNAPRKATPMLSISALNKRVRMAAHASSANK
jgi:hypothetical protein